ncbi:MAG: transferase [Propionibacteriaceae bacterium]|nr:transferase [Propionibacteriaceae bacterium]
MTTATARCLLCGGGDLEIVLDLGEQPSVRHWPLPDDPLPDQTHPLALGLCHGCGLVQLERDDTSGPELQVPEPRAVVEQARQAVADLDRLGHLAGRRTVAEFTSPHGGSWLPHLDLTPTTGPADLVVDNFALMHETDLPQALRRRAEALADGGLAVFWIQPLGDIVRTRQWRAVRHGHPGYFSLTSLGTALATVGLVPTRVLRYPLYGGVALVLCEPGGVPDAELAAALAAEAPLGSAHGLAPLAEEVECHVARLRDFLTARRAAGTRLYAYPAASKAVTELAMVGDAARAVLAVGDASPAKQGRCLPASRIPVISPEQLLAADPDEVLLLLPDLAPELRESFPQLADRLVDITEVVTDGDH